MSIGYACIHIGSEKTKLFSLRLKNAHPEQLQLVTAKNLDALGAILRYNIAHQIHLFRISSDIIPLGSHPANTLPWWQIFKPKLDALGQLIKANDIRVSMHPGQYTVLNSPNPAVVARALDDLFYHARFLNALGCDTDCKIILHIGGVYGEKSAAEARFVGQANALPPEIKSRLVIENDDHSYTTQDVLRISGQTGLPVVFDYLHHHLNPSALQLDDADWLLKCRLTWQAKDGRQKIHYSESAPNGSRGAHSATIGADTFLSFINQLPDPNIDVMLEVKDKNLSAVKCILLNRPKIKMADLEREWAKYKYWTLSRSATIYNAIRGLLKEKSKPDALAFYRLIEKAAALPPDIGAEINAAQHVWGYVSAAATDRDKRRFETLVTNLKDGILSPTTLKRFLFRLAQAQQVDYLKGSLYFYL